MTSDDLRLIPGARVLVAERSEPNARQVAEYLRAVGYDVLVATDGEEALRSIRRDDPEIAILDVGIPRLNAYQLCERVKNHPSTRNIPVVMLVSPSAQDEKIRGLEVGAEDFLCRPVNKLELLARVRSLVKVKRLNDQVETTENVIFGLARMLEKKVSNTSSDWERLADHACLLGHALGLTEEDLDILRKGAILHDIGKIAVREEVLMKPGRLSSEEFNEIKLHPEMGERICGPLRCADQVLPVIRHHQERWDGKGYPDGLRGEQIPLLARILSIADAYDAMLSPRPYRAALEPEVAQQNLEAGSGAQWDPHLVSVFLSAVKRREPVLV
ncbi:MAG TPA: HD domain-containing phosphohydrolase [Armatimonadota bacterium]|nr:HD domain-containing phosphohydrolase [Armatimonadota bacterium]